MSVNNPAVASAQADPYALLRYRTLFSRIDQGFCVCQMIVDDSGTAVDYRFLEINEAFCGMTGLPTDAVGRTALEMVPNLEPRWVDTYARVGLGGQALRFEESSDAMGRSFDVFATPVEPHGCFALVFTDITARRQAEAALRLSEARFRTMADTAPAVLWVTDIDNRLEFLSRGWFEQTGQEVADAYASGFGWLAMVHPDDREAASRELATRAAAREPLTIEYRLRQADGSYRWALDAGRPRFDEHGEWLGYIGSVFDVHDRTEAREALRDAARRKDEFVAVLAHELRNPLAPIRTGLDVLRRTSSQEPVPMQVRAMMERQVAHMVRLVDDLLDVSRLATGKITLQLQRSALRDLVHNAVDANRAVLDAGHLALDIDVPDVHVDVDPTRFVQIVSNLLHNATKFTKAHGHVRITGTLVRDVDAAPWLDLVVADDGEGIPEEMLATIFEPFTQGPAHGSHGLGIGLALARQLTELHGGQIEAHSGGAGTGSRFSVRMPAQVPGVGLLEVDPAPRTPATARRVVVIDDNRDAADSMALLVSALGAQAEVGYDGAEALSRVREQQPDLVLLDLGMPLMDGFEVCRRIRAEPHGAAISIVAVTGWGQEQDRKRTREAGFDGHLTKPVDPETLERVLARPPRGGEGGQAGDV